MPTGEPADWTNMSAVLAEVPDRIHCARLLPNRRTLRFVWGTPMQAEDVDMLTRVRSTVAGRRRRVRGGVPRPFARRQPPPYQGRAPDGRAFAFLSPHPDGRDAVPVVQTAEPSMASEPTWLADGQTFSFDIDLKHMGVFSTRAGRMNVLPDVTTRSFVTIFRYVIANRVFLGTMFDNTRDGDRRLRGPLLNEEERFRLPHLALDLRLEGAQMFFAQHKQGRGRNIMRDRPRGAQGACHRPHPRPVAALSDDGR